MKDVEPGWQFASDNSAGICPEAWGALAAANVGYAPSYGDDSWTQRACDLIRALFDHAEAQVFFVFNGTAANALGLAALCQGYHGVLCHEQSHVQTDECGAPEFFSHGAKLLTVGGSSSTSGSKAKPITGTTQVAYKAEAELSPPAPAPPIVLHNYLGQPVDLASYKGKAVLVTFLYTNCPDVCPLITSNLRVALNMLGKRASQVQVIAVSVDPRGDTQANVARFVREHEMVGRMQYLIGSAGELAPTWAAWHVGSTREVGQPELVAHSALVYGITAGGVLKTIYPSTFEPSEIVHDVPKLAAQ